MALLYTKLLPIDLIGELFLYLPLDVLIELCRSSIPFFQSVSNCDLSSWSKRCNTYYNYGIFQKNYIFSTYVKHIFAVVDEYDKHKYKMRPRDKTYEEWYSELDTSFFSLQQCHNRYR